MKKASFLVFFIVATLFIGCSQTPKPKTIAPPAPAGNPPVKQKSKPGLQIEIITVKELADVSERYKTMYDIPEGRYLYWRMDRWAAYGTEFVNTPNQKDSTLVEVLTVIKNDSSKSEKFRLKNPKLELTRGQSAPAWEYWIPGLAADYNAVADHLQLTKGPAVQGSRIPHEFIGDVYCELKSKQQTWVIFIFQVPNGTKTANLVIGNYPPVGIQIGIKSDQAPIVPSSKYSDESNPIFYYAIIGVLAIVALSFALWYRHRKTHLAFRHSEQEVEMIDQQSASNRDPTQSLSSTSKRNALVIVCLTILLIASLIAASIYVYYFDPDELKQMLKASLIIKNASFIMVLLNIVFLIMLLARKMIGFFGVVAIGIIAFLLYTFKGVGFYWFIGPGEIAILIGVLQIKKNGISAWSILK